MLIGVPLETALGETRVAVTPETAKKLKALGHTLRIQSGAGVAASATDEAYAAVGAEITDAAGAFGCELVLQGGQGGAGFSGVVGEQHHRGVAGNGRAEVQVAGAHRSQVGRPIAIGPRPGHQHGPLGFPFRG